MASVQIRGIQKAFGSTQVIRGVDIDIPDGQFAVLVGPSGCGKSTLLRMLAGLEEITEGEIAIDGRVVNNVQPKERDIAMVFQNYALYPHMTVRDNMAFSLMLAKVDKPAIAERVKRAADILGLGELLDRYPRQLSGGQRQRVAMGRAIVREPAVFLFDEPLSNLDAKLRVQMRLEIQKMHRALGTTSLYVTHDQVEAMTLGQRMIVMNGGRAEQIGTPADVYSRPATTFVASFIGSPPMNLLRGRAGAAGSFQLDGNGTVTLPAGVAAPVQGECILGVRPEHLRLGQPGISMEVELVESLGADLLVHGRAGNQTLVIRTPAGTAVSAGQQVSAGFDAVTVHWFDAASTQRLN